MSRNTLVHFGSPMGTNYTAPIEDSHDEEDDE